MLPDDPRHGSEAGHEQHIRDDETPCAACYEAKLIAGRRRRKRKMMGQPPMMPLGHVLHRRIAAMRRKGATYDDIAEWAGISVSQGWRVATSGPDAMIYTRTWRRIAEMEPGRILTPIGITRRLQALQWLGYGFPTIAAESGVHHDTVLDATRYGPREFLAHRVREGIADAYERLSMRVPEGTTSRERAGITRVRNNARKLGYHPPLAWDDIDDPDETPVRVTKASQQRSKTDLDPVVVQRVLAGDKTLHMTRAERVAVVQKARALGLSEREIHERTGITQAASLQRWGGAA